MIYPFGIGSAYQDSSSNWFCSPGPPMALTVPPLSSKRKGASPALIAGVTAPLATAAFALVAFIYWRRTRKSKEDEPEPNPTPVDSLEFEELKIEGVSYNPKDTFQNRNSS